MSQGKGAEEEEKKTLLWGRFFFCFILFLMICDSDSRRVLDQKVQNPAATAAEADEGRPRPQVETKRVSI
jgi:hypothetical protein